MTIKNYLNTPTPQSEKLNQRQAENNAGGYTYVIDKWSRLERFLILGSDAGTYYVNSRQLTKENATCALECIAEDPKKTVAAVLDVLDNNKAAKVDPSIFVLSLVASDDDPATRKCAYEVVPGALRTATHLFMFLSFVRAQRGFSTGLNKAVARWYRSRQPSQLGYQMAKYRNREGWTHRDALRISHPHFGSNEQYHNLARWAVGGDYNVDMLPDAVQGFLLAQEGDYESALEKNVSWEMFPTEVHKNPDFWKSMIANDRIPYRAMLRNLSRFSSLGVTDDRKALATIVAKLEDPSQARIHPYNIFEAMTFYKIGKNRNLQWVPVPKIVDTLDKAFYLSFKNVEPTNANILIALDVSGSMGWSFLGQQRASYGGINARDASVAMALITLNVEPNATVMAFANAEVERTYHYSLQNADKKNVSGIIPIGLSARRRLDDNIAEVNKYSRMFTGTDCSLPARWATANEQEFDAFITYTDSETWAGPIHPSVALDDYRKQSKIAAKNIVVGMTSTEFSIADPDDMNSLDVVGFDSSAPGVISNFITG